MMDAAYEANSDLAAQSSDEAQWPAWPWLAAAAVWLAWRLQSGPGVWDAGELTAAAAGLGGSHPPGQPLHALMGYALTLLPLGSMPLRVALGSALGELLAAWVVVAITRRLLRRMARQDIGMLREFAAHAAGLGCLLAAPMWRQGSRVEVYGLALALTLASVERQLAWADGDGAALRWGALFAGLAAALHPPHALAAVTVGAALLVTLRREALPRWRALPWATLAFLTGLSVYLYLPLRGYAGATLWGDTSSWSGLWRYVSGAAYRNNLSPSRSAHWATLAYLLRAATPAATVGALLLLGLTLRRWREAHRPPADSKSPEFAGASAARTGPSLLDDDLASPRRAEPPPPALALHASSALQTGRRSRHAWAFLALPWAAAVGFLLQPVEPLNPDNVAYAGPATALLLAMGAATLASLPTGPRSRPVLACMLASLFAVPAIADDLVASGRADGPSLETLAGELVGTPPTRALVVVRSDFAGSAWMLARTADEARPDVALLVEGLATSSWHWRSLAHHPLFDGSPLRGQGPNAQLAWVNGAVRQAAGRVPIVSESDLPLGALGVVVGPYLELPAGPPADEDALGSRPAALEAELGREAREARASDSDVVRGVLRKRALRRARRLLARGEVRASGVAYRQALAFLPEEALTPFDQLGPPRMPAPPIVRDPQAMLPTEGDALREAACSVLVAGDPVDAFGLLQLDERRGDPRALLQFAVFEWARGASAEARQALARFDAQAPELHAEADDLRRALADVNAAAGQ